MPRKKISKNSYSLLTDMTVDGDVYTAKNNLYAWYQLDSDPTATVIDKSGNSRSLTPGLAPSLSSDIIEHKTSGFPKSSFSFNSNDLTRVDFGNSFTFNEPGFSGAAWIKIPDYSTNHFIMSKFKDPTDPGGADWEWIFQIPGSGKLNLSLYQNAVASRSTSSAQDVPVNEWLHVGFVYNGSTGTTSLYINGKNVSVTTNNAGTFGQVQDTNAKFVVGWNDGQYHSYDTIGNIAEVALWNEKLTDSDFSVLYKIIAPSMESGFVNLPPRIEIRNRDNATGSYPTTLRMGDKDRTGNYRTRFDDTNTITFGRRIRDNFELRDEDKIGGVLGYTKNINTKNWIQSGDLEIRKELFTTAGGSTARDGALVLAGAGDADGRWLQTKEKIKNPTVLADIIFGPYNESRTALGFGLGLKSPATDLKVQVSTTGLDGSWTTIKTLTGNVDALFAESAFSIFSDFSDLIQKRKRTKIKLTPSDFSSVGSSEFYLRFAQTSVTDSNQAEWAIGYVNIDYHNENVNYPLMIDATSRVGQRVASGAIASPHALPTITAPGRSISGISDVHIKFTPGEGVSAFDDARINISPEDYFFQQGSDPAVSPGMSSPLWSKTQIVFDLSPNEETTFGMTTPSTGSGGSDEEDDKVKQQLMVYWNNDLRRWEKIAQGVSGNAMGNSLENMIASGALGFSSIDVVSTGSDSSYANQVVYPTNVLSSYVRPTSVFGFPFEGKYHATASQYVKAKDLGITKPFVLEKCQISFDSKFEFPFDEDSASGDGSEHAYALLYSYNNAGDASFRNIELTHRAWIPTFFILRQQDYDNFSAKIEYDYDYKQYLTGSSRTIQSPSNSKLSTNNEDLTYVESSREMITYGQITLFTSSSAMAHNFSIRDVLDKGISRDAEVDILQANGQGSDQLGSTTTINPLTGSFIVNFPCRVTGKVKGGVTARVKNSDNNPVGLRLDNRLGGRSYGNLDSSARGLVNGTPALSSAGTFKITSANTEYLPIDIDIQNAESFDIYSPYIIMPEDNLVLGWQYPMTSMIRQRAPGSDCTRFNSMTLYGNSKLTLFGSQLQDGIEFHETVNQNLGSDAIHEMIGSEPVVDQFEVSRAIENRGNYLDNYIAVNTEEPTRRIGSFVQSRLTSEKGSSGAATATISMDRDRISFLGGLKRGGFEDGIRIGIQDATGYRVNFFGFRREPAFPINNGTVFTANPATLDNDSDGNTEDTFVGNLGWTTAVPGQKYVRLDTATWTYGGSNKVLGVRYSSGTPPANVEYPAFGPAGSGNNAYDYAGDFDNPASSAVADEVWAFQVYGDYAGAKYSQGDQTQVIVNLANAINSSGLRLKVEVDSGYDTVYLTQLDGGAAGNTSIIRSYPEDIDSSGTLVRNYFFSKTNFSGGNDLVASALGSFVRVSPTEDSIRIYSDSLLTSSSIDSPFGPESDYTGFGTFLTNGNPIRPKYYLDTRKYGQSIHFLEQAKDSKATQNIKTRRTGLLNSLKGGALQAPVVVQFVSGSTSDTTGVQTYTAIEAVNSSAVNKTINSVLTGAFYEV